MSPEIIDKARSLLLGKVRRFEADYVVAKDVIHSLRDPEGFREWALRQIGYKIGTEIVRSDFTEKNTYEDARGVYTRLTVHGFLLPTHFVRQLHDPRLHAQTATE